MSASGDQLSLRGYAAHRRDQGLPGHSHEAVRRAIQSGRLERSVVMVGGKPKIRSADEADQEWLEHTRHAQEGDEPEPTPGEGDEVITYNEARRRHEIERWRQARVKRELEELDLAHRRGELVSVDEARADVVKRFAAVREKILGLPSRIRQRTDVTEDEVALITDLVYEALESIALRDEDEDDGSGED